MDILTLLLTSMALVFTVVVYRQESRLEAFRHRIDNHERQHTQLIYEIDQMEEDLHHTIRA